MRVGHQADLVRRDDVSDFIRNVGSFCRFFVQAGAGSQQVKNPDDRGTDEALLLIADAVDMICRGAGFHLGGPGQSQPHGFAGEAVEHFDSVAYSINGRIAGLEVGVDPDAAGFTDVQPCVFRQRGFGTDAHCHDDGVRFNLSVAGKDLLHTVF